MPDKAPLAGLRIIEISSFVAAPLGGMTLANERLRIEIEDANAEAELKPVSPKSQSAELLVTDWR